MFDDLDKSVKEFDDALKEMGFNIKKKGEPMDYEVKYTLIAKVDDEVVYRESFEDTAELQSKLYKPEKAVENKLKELEGDIDE